MRKEFRQTRISALSAFTAFLLLACVILAHSQDASESDIAIMTFHFSWPEAKPDRYSIQAQKNGLALYWVGPPDFNLSEAVGVRKLQISQETTDAIFAASAAVSTERCETREKNIARTGSKTLIYAANHNSKSCTFNYSDTASVQQATNTFMALAETIQIGDELSRLRRFDRLGLDAEVTHLESELNCGRAIEVENIAPTLQAISDDDRVMDRVRRKAAHLLETTSANHAKQE